jgi:hypothetical protein
VFHDLFAIGVIWAVGALVLYWNLEGKGVLPSNDHVRVLAVLWPAALVYGAGWAGLHAFRYVTKSVVTDTVVAFQNVADWRYHEGRILPPPKDVHEMEARREVDKLLEER